MRTQWPLVGRAEELDLLERTLTASRHRGVVLSGPAGVGKTRLGAELLDRARRAGWHTLRVSATRSMATVAFGALIHLLPVGGDAVESTLELMRRLRDELARLGRDRPVLLFVDDAHTLDEASAGTAHMLAATGTAFVVVAVRSREPVPDAVAALWKDDLAPRLELRPLSRGEAGELVRAALGGQVDGVTDHRLWHTTRGNALYLSELVRALLDSGHLAERGGVWSWTGDIALGDRLTELIEARLAGLAAEERTLLEVLALGEPLEPALLARVAGQPVESLAALEERGLVSVGDDGVRLGHPLHGEILRPTIGTLRRRSLYGALADAPTADGRRPGDLIRLATWRLEAGGRLDAPTLVAAARQARALFDHRLAERFARCAVTVGGDTDAYPLLADALYWQGRYTEALTVLDSTPADPNRTADSLAWQAIVTASTRYWGLGDTAGALRALTDAQQRVGPGPQHEDLAAHRATITLFNGRPKDALAIAEPVLTTPAAAIPARARALVATIFGLAATGRTGDAVTAAETGVALARVVADREPWALSHFRAGQVTAYWLGGRLADMRALAEQAYAEATSRSADDDRGMWAFWLGRALLAAGRVRSALAQLREASELLRQHDIGGFLSWSRAAQTIAAALVGDVPAATGLLAEANRCGRPGMHMHAADLDLAGAWLAAARGERSRAGRLALDAASAAAGRGQHMLAAIALHDATRLGVAGLHRRMATVARTGDGTLVPAFAAHARALATGDGPGLDDAAERFAAAGAVLLAAEAAAQAAAAHGKAGNAAAQLAATNRAGGLAARCEGATTPVLRDAARVPAVGALTAREREIAELVALGLSNKDVARRLVVSVRTVGNHLNHVYGKLGVGRADLPALLNVHSGQSELGTPPGSAGTLIRLAEAKPAVPLDRPADTG